MAQIFRAISTVVKVGGRFTLLTDFLPLMYEDTSEITGTTSMDIERFNPILTAKIVGSYVRQHKVSPEQLPEIITSVHQTLGQLGQPVQPEEILAPAVSVRRSVSQEYVICLDCGYRGKTLRRHINSQHGFSRDEYLRRWGLRSDHPLTAPAYSERRSTMAKALGFGRKPKAQAAPAVTPTAVPSSADADGKFEATPKRRRRSRSASQSAEIANEAVEAPTPARKRRSRSRNASPQP
jgi:predicted transcriptional regulator